MAEGLQYKVGLDASGFVAGTKLVVGGFETITTAGKATFKSFEALGAQIARLKKGLADAPSAESYSRIARAITAAQNQLGGLGRSAANAAPALFSLSQVARDLPFGFIAIQNNLPQVVDSFTALKQSTGGTLPALKALAGSLVGPAGIGFAFSVVTSAITTLVQKYGSLSAALSDIFGLSNGTAQAQAAMAKAFSDVAGESAAEAQTVKNLVAILNDHNKTNEQRANTFQRIKKEYPGIIQNMTEENALSKAGGELIAKRSEQLIKYIKLKGQEKALTDLIAKASSKQLESMQEIDKVNKGGFDALVTGFQLGLKKLVTGQDYGKLLTKPLTDAGEEIDFFTDKLLDTQSKISEIDFDIIDPSGLKKSKAEVDRTLNEILKAQIKSAEANLQLDELTNVQKFKIRARIIDLQQKLDKLEAKQSIKNRRALNTALLAIDKEAQVKRKGNTIERATVTVDDQLSGTLKGTEEQFARMQRLLGVPLVINGDVKPFIRALTEAELASLTFAANVKAIMESFSQDITNTLQKGATDALSGLSDALSEFASGKGFNLGKVFAGVGQVLQDIGKSAIQTGIAVLGLKKALSVAISNPALLIAAGVALAALGGVIKAKFSKSAGLAQGGIVPPGFPNDSFPARLTSNEAVIPLDRLEQLVGGINSGGGGVLYCDVNGDKLRFVLDRTDRRQGR